MEFLLISIFTFLAFYGMLHITMEIVTSIAQRNRDDGTHAYTVIAVKDRECEIEGIVRAAALRQLRLANSGNVPEIYVVDMGSHDKTYEILQRLTLEYEFLKAFKSEEYIGIFAENAM